MKLPESCTASVPAAENIVEVAQAESEKTLPSGVNKVIHVHYHYIVNPKPTEEQPKLLPADNPLSSLKNGTLVHLFTDIHSNSCLGVTPEGKLIAQAGIGGNGQWRVQRNQDRFLFCSVHNPRWHLRIGKQGKVAHNGGTGSWAQFLIEVVGSQILLKSYGNKDKPRYIAVKGNSVTSSPHGSRFFVAPCVHQENSAGATKQNPKQKEKPKAAPQEPSAILSPQEALQEGNVVSICSFADKQNRKRGNGWYLGVSPEGMLVPDAGQGTWGHWRIKRVGKDGNICFESVHTPRWHLRVDANGRVTPKGGTGGFAQFAPIFHPNGRVSFSCVAHKAKTNSDGKAVWCIAVCEDGNIIGNADAQQPVAQFTVKAESSASPDAAPAKPAERNAIQRQLDSVEKKLKAIELQRDQAKVDAERLMSLAEKDAKRLQAARKLSALNNRFNVLQRRRAALAQKAEAADNTTVPAPSASPAGCVSPVFERGTSAEDASIAKDSDAKTTPPEASASTPADAGPGMKFLRKMIKNPALLKDPKFMHGCSQRLNSVVAVVEQVDPETRNEILNLFRGFVNSLEQACSSPDGMPTSSH